MRARERGKRERTRERERGIERGSERKAYLFAKAEKRARVRLARDIYMCFPFVGDLLGPLGLCSSVFLVVCR